MSICKPRRPDGRLISPWVLIPAKMPSPLGAAVLAPGVRGRTVSLKKAPWRGDQGTVGEACRRRMMSVRSLRAARRAGCAFKGVLRYAYSSAPCEHTGASGRSMPSAHAACARSSSSVSS